MSPISVGAIAGGVRSLKVPQTLAGTNVLGEDPGWIPEVTWEDPSVLSRPTPIYLPLSSFLWPEVTTQAQPTPSSPELLNDQLALSSWHCLLSQVSLAASEGSAQHSLTLSLPLGASLSWEIKFSLPISVWGPLCSCLCAPSLTPTPAPPAGGPHAPQLCLLPAAFVFARLCLELPPPPPVSFSALFKTQLRCFLFRRFSLTPQVPPPRPRTLSTLSCHFVGSWGCLLPLMILSRILSGSCLWLVAACG
jgi:hypothetical protein